MPAPSLPPPLFLGVSAQSSQESSSKHVYDQLWTFVKHYFSCYFISSVFKLWGKCPHRLMELHTHVKIGFTGKSENFTSSLGRENVKWEVRQTFSSTASPAREHGIRTGNAVVKRINYYTIVIISIRICSWWHKKVGSTTFSIHQKQGIHHMQIPKLCFEGQLHFYKSSTVYLLMLTFVTDFLLRQKYTILASRTIGIWKFHPRHYSFFEDKIRLQDAKENTNDLGFLLFFWYFG